MEKSIVVFKNDRIGDLIWSVDSICYLAQKYNNHKLVLFLSNINFSMNFLFNEKNINFLKINYRPTLIEKIKIFFFFLTNNIDKVYIFRPEIFYFLLPVFFFYKKIKFYGLCVDDINNYKRPSMFIRNFLYKTIINDRSSKSIRPHTTVLQKHLVEFNENEYSKKNFLVEKNNKLPSNYILFHFKRKMFDTLGWSESNLQELISTISSKNKPIVLIKDKEKDDYNNFFKINYNYINLKSNEVVKNKTNIYFVDEVEDRDFFNVISCAAIVIAPHGTVTSIAYLNNLITFDLFFFGKKKIGFYEAKNSFHEFKPKNKNYNFITTSTNFYKTLQKLNLFLDKI